jgi:CheY-like chemotaxis protein
MGPVLVLVVEDEAFLLLELIAALEEAGFSVADTMNAPDAVALLGEEGTGRCHVVWL